jgi:hypothetical protein
MSAGDEVFEGRQALASGRVRNLREKYDLSWPVLANLIGVDATSLKLWCDGTRVPSHASARKLGAWITRVDAVKASRRRPEDLVSLSMASQYLGMSYATVLAKCQARELTCVDLGPLGTYILKSDIPILEDHHD